MKKKFYILMCLASLVLMVTACGGKEKIKEKLRAATEAVKERKEAAASEKGSDLEMDKQGDRPDNGAFVDPSLTPAQRKALDKEQGERGNTKVGQNPLLPFLEQLWQCRDAYPA